MKMLSSSRPPCAPPASRSRSDSVERISLQREPGQPLVQDPGDLLHRVRPRPVPGTSTKIVRTTPLRRLNTSSSRSALTGTSSSRSSTTSSSAGRHRHAELLGQDPEYLGGAAQDLLHRARG